MTKRKGSEKNGTKKNQTMMFGGMLAAVILLGIGLILMSSNQSTTVTAEISSGKISPQQYQSTYISESNEHLLVDVRTPEEFASGHIAGAVNIPLQELPDRLSEIPTDKAVVVYCRSGNRSAQASNILTSNNYTNIYDMGGISRSFLFRSWSWFRL